MGFMDIRSFHDRAQAVFAKAQIPRIGNDSDAALPEVQEDRWSLPKINPNSLMRYVCEQNGWVPVQMRTYASIPGGVRTSQFWQKLWRNRLADSAADGCIDWEPPSYSPAHRSMTTRASEVLAQIGMDVVTSVLKKHCDVVILFSSDATYDVIVDKVRTFGKNQFIKLASVYPYQQGSRFAGINRTDWLPVTEDVLVECFDSCIRLPATDSMAES